MHAHTQTQNMYEQNLINFYYFTYVAIWEKAARDYIHPCKKAVTSLPASGHNQGMSLDQYCAEEYSIITGVIWKLWMTTMSSEINAQNYAI